MANDRPPQQPDDQEASRRSTEPQERLDSPHAGRVGPGGARAERPEDSKRKPPAELQPGRGAKAPSANGLS